MPSNGILSIKKTPYDFANILFSGKCNRYCPFCIGKSLPKIVNIDNLELYPLLNQEKFLIELQKTQTTNIIFTGTISDPQLYKFETKLIDEIRIKIPLSNISLHTNGALALKKILEFNSYNKACISFPTFEKKTYKAMMGTENIPDLSKILAKSKIEIKISAVITEHNITEIDSFISKLRYLGIKRLVLRKLFGEKRTWNLFQGLQPVKFFRNNPVYEVDGMEITYWDFDDTNFSSINLFPNGLIGTSYLLTETKEIKSNSI